MNERIYGTNSNINWTNSIFQADSSNFGELSTSKIIHEPKDEFFSFGSHESLCTQTRLSQIDLHPPLTQVQLRAQEPNNKLAANLMELKALKRKASDIDLNLDLSLKLNSRVITSENQGGMEDLEVDSNLSLSLYSQSSSSYLSSRLKEAQDHCKDQGERASALDLTL